MSEPNDRGREVAQEIYSTNVHFGLGDSAYKIAAYREEPIHD